MGRITELLRAARDKIMDPGHWTKGSFYRPTLDGHGSYCSHGCLQWAMQEGRYSHSDLSAAASVLANSISGVTARGTWRSPDETIFLFNDDPYTTHEQVLDCFDRAIKTADEQGL